MKKKEIARVAHEANRVICDFFGDHSQVSWKSAPDWQKESAILGVKAVAKNPKITPKDLHEKWMETKVKDGWVYGDVKDPVAKTHPCMVAYSELPREQQLKDAMFSAIVKNLLK